MKNMKYRSEVVNCCKALNAMFEAWFDAGINIFTGESGKMGFAKAVVIYDEDDSSVCDIAIVIDDRY